MRNEKWIETWNIFFSFCFLSVFIVSRKTRNVVRSIQRRWERRRRNKKGRMGIFLTWNHKSFRFSLSLLLYYHFGDVKRHTSISETEKGPAEASKWRRKKLHLTLGPTIRIFFSRWLKIFVFTPETRKSFFFLHVSTHVVFRVRILWGVCFDSSKSI